MPGEGKVFARAVRRPRQPRKEPDGPRLRDEALIGRALPLAEQVVIESIATLLPVNDLGRPEGPEVFGKNPLQLLPDPQHLLWGRPIAYRGTGRLSGIPRGSELAPDFREAERE
jgi:hypothetical protein